MSCKEGLRGCFVYPKHAVNDGNLCYTIPGGEIESGETPEQAMFRELMQETGLGKEDAIFVAMLGNPLEHATERGQKKLVHPFVVLIDGAHCNLVPAPDSEIAGAHWYSSIYFEHVFNHMGYRKQKLVYALMSRTIMAPGLPKITLQQLDHYLRSHQPVYLREAA
jgi:8-oxo-dGTP pyrophosphatase MutT (NUDIX family)